jgi:hypothetical protein
MAGSSSRRVSGNSSRLRSPCCSCDNRREGSLPWHQSTEAMSSSRSRSLNTFTPASPGAASGRLDRTKASTSRDVPQPARTSRWWTSGATGDRNTPYRRSCNDVSPGERQCHTRATRRCRAPAAVNYTKRGRIYIRKDVSYPLSREGLESLTAAGFLAPQSTTPLPR